MAESIHLTEAFLSSVTSSEGSRSLFPDYSRVKASKWEGDVYKHCATTTLAGADTTLVKTVVLHRPEVGKRLR